MFHEIFHIVLVNGVRLASAILPAVPLLGQKFPTCHMVIQEEPAKVAAVIDQAAKEA